MSKQEYDYGDLEAKPASYDYGDLEKKPAALPATSPPSDAHPFGTYGALIMGVDPGTLWDRVSGAIASVVNRLQPGGSTKDTRRTIPELTPEQSIGEKAVTVGSLAGPLTELGAAAGKLIPNAERAGAKFTMLREAAKEVPVNTEEAYKSIQRAEELVATGHAKSMPDVMAKFKTALQPASIDMGGEQVLVPPSRLKYPSSFDFASAAKNPSIAEKSAATDTMLTQVRTFAHALQTANRDAAESIGMGDVFDSAMKEYRQAKNLKDALDVAQKWAVKAAVTTGLGIVGLKGAEKLINAVH